MKKQGHYIFIDKDDAEEFSSIVDGTVTYSIVHCRYNVWFEYEDADNIDFIQKFMIANSVLRKKLKNAQEDVTRLRAELNRKCVQLRRYKNEYRAYKDHWGIPE